MRGLATLLMLFVLSGCQLAALKPPGADALLLADWLDISAEISALTPEQAADALLQVGDGEDPTARFRYAMLNQQLHQRDGWVVARDRFRTLKNSAVLPREARQLAALLEQLNQLQINHEQQLGEQTRLAQERAAEAELLQEKIRALTNLEDSMNQRREKRSTQP
ncbi:hypothetical protein [Motiliproteus sediminis]|uniref:hypothetical protein n=1 Tax=Motiliproteus sediminis TaxID=1468178 RepID=UPI001AEF4878|nr:hypothetical protein [Motiliproteus sediminis]